MRALAIFWRGFLASFLAGLGTVVGALWIFLFRRPSPRAEDALFSGAAGAYALRRRRGDAVGRRYRPARYSRRTRRRGGYEDLATFSLLGGFAVMMFLDVVFA